MMYKWVNSMKKTQKMDRCITAQGIDAQSEQVIYTMIFIIVVHACSMDREMILA